MSKEKILEEEWASFEKLIDGEELKGSSEKKDCSIPATSLPKRKFTDGTGTSPDIYSYEVQYSSSPCSSRSNSPQPGRSDAGPVKEKVEAVGGDLPAHYRPKKDSGKGSSTSRSRSHSQSPKRSKKSKDKHSRSRSRDRYRDRKSGSKREKRRQRSSSRHRSNSPHSKRSSSRSRKRSSSRHRSRSRDGKRSRDRKSSRERHRHGSKDRSHRRKHSSPRKYKSRSRSPRKHRSRSRSSHRRRSKSKSPRRYKSRSPRGYKSRSPWRRRGRSYSRSRSRSYSPRRLRDTPLDSYKKKIMGTLAKKSKPLTFREKMRQDLIKASKLLSDQSENGTLLDDSMKLTAAQIAITGDAKNVTPQMALLQTMAAMHQKAQELTGVSVPKYYNPAAVNPLKYAEQFQKRKLLWSKNKEKKEEKGDQWQGTAFKADDDGKISAKFRKLMGMKEDQPITDDALTDEQRAKRDELFQRLDQDYEFARMSTHTHRGVGLGFASQGMSMPQFPQP